MGVAAALPFKKFLAPAVANLDPRRLLLSEIRRRFALCDDAFEIVFACQIE
jgi:hypothetical protein